MIQAQQAERIEVNTNGIMLSHTLIIHASAKTVLLTLAKIRHPQDEFFDYMGISGKF
jgi:hypothetical protein